VADHPLRPATDRRLGGPLPRQQANRTQAALKAPFGFGPRPPCGISPSFPGLSPTSRHIPTRFSPVRRSPRGARDLHVLGVPPAFALSQDQTLRFVARDRAEAASRRCLSPGSAHHSRCKALPGHESCLRPPLRDDMGRQAGCACLLPKDRCSCQRSALPDRRARVGTAPGRQRAAPHHRGANEHVPEGTGFGIRSRTAIRSEDQGQRPGTSSARLEGATAPLQEA
jgi:hypothetical protein